MLSTPSLQLECTEAKYGMIFKTFFYLIIIQALFFIKIQTNMN